jgi:hypothetical protein
MADIEIVCVNRDTKTKRLVEIGIRPAHKIRTHRLISVQAAIARRKGGDRLFVDYEGKLVPVDEVDGPKRKYLRTYPDGIVEDNLEHLRSCVPTSDSMLTGNSIDDSLQGKL